MTDKMPRWELIGTWTQADRHHTVFRDNDLHIQMEVVGRVPGCGAEPRSHNHYYIDGQPGSYASEAELMAAWREQRGMGDD